MFRQLTESDLTQYLALWSQGVRADPAAFLLTAAEVAEIPEHTHLAQLGRGRCWGAFQNDSLVAMAVLQRCGPQRLQHVAELGPVVTHPDARGQGLARRLLQDMIQWAIEAGLLQIELCVDEDNSAALSLYRRLGFEQIGRRPRSLLIEGQPRNDLILLLQLDCG